MAVLLYGVETWTLLSADLRRLEAFHMKRQRQLLDVHWWDNVWNASIREETGLTSTANYLQRRCLSLLGHVACMYKRVLANRNRLMTDFHGGMSPDPQWKRPRGRLSHTWLLHIQEDNAVSPLELWTSEVARNHRGAAQWSPTMRQWRRWFVTPGVCRYSVISWLIHKQRVTCSFAFQTICVIFQLSVLIIGLNKKIGV